MLGERDEISGGSCSDRASATAERNRRYAIHDLMFAHEINQNPSYRHDCCLHLHTRHHALETHAPCTHLHVDKARRGCTVCGMGKMALPLLLVVLVALL